MEVCGGHTMAIHKFGLQSMLPDTIELLSGPGCPVCVTDHSFIDRAVAYSRLPDTILATFGDLIRVPGSTSSLAKEKASGGDIRIVYAPFDAVEIAKANPTKRVIFLGIGFETTAPTSAAAVKQAYQLGLENFFLYSSHKLMPPAMTALITEGVKIDGYICPGHVSAITGSHIYEPLVQRCKIGCVITGFEPTDLLQAILMLVKQFETKHHQVEIQYNRVVKPEGNLLAQKLLDQIFVQQDDEWRGIGLLPGSGLKLSPAYSYMDAYTMIDLKVEDRLVQRGCICGEILKGQKSPKQCALFGKACTPISPVGACMVSNEGSCSTYYRYG